MTLEMYLRSLVLVVSLYFGSAALFYGLLYRLKFFKSRKLESTIPENISLAVQVRYSIIYLCGAAFFDAVFVTIAYARYTQIYNKLDHMGLWYFAGSVILYILTYEIFYYFSHRMLHTDFLYKHVHHIHHKVSAPTVLSIYCFHPLEALSYFIFHMGFVLLVPFHPAALIITSIFLHQGNLMGHLGYEILPSFVRKKWTYLNSPTGHFLHHQIQNCNYGYTFTILDKMFKTYQMRPLPQKKSSE